jgi:hypothetical protein
VMMIRNCPSITNDHWRIFIPSFSLSRMDEEKDDEGIGACR